MKAASSIGRVCPEIGCARRVDVSQKSRNPHSSIKHGAHIGCMPCMILKDGEGGPRVGISNGRHPSKLPVTIKIWKVLCILNQICIWRVNWPMTGIYSSNSIPGGPSTCGRVCPEIGCARRVDVSQKSRNPHSSIKHGVHIVLDALLDMRSQEFTLADIRVYLIVTFCFHRRCCYYTRQPLFWLINTIWFSQLM